MNTLYNNIKKNLHVALLAVSLCGVGAGFTSCNDYLDVTPKSQLEEKDLFSRESGYNDQLVGVYTKMMDPAMYGQQMTYGFAEVLSQNYNINSSSTLWRYVEDYDYKNSNVESVINSIWLNSYSCITNLNVLIENIEKADKGMFTEGNDSIYLGEAIGLRAFLHLDLMRYFASAPSMDMTAKGVPYVTTYGTHVTEQKSVAETMALIIADLTRAYNLLKADPACKQCSRFDYYKAQNRLARFNYNACVAALARAYMWIGDTQNALKYAEEIISMNDGDTEGDRPFSWVHYSCFQSSQKSDHQPSFYTEMLFRMVMNDWEDGGSTYFHAVKGVDALSPSTDYVNDVYELSNGLGADYRLAYGYEQDGSDRYMSKFWYVPGRAGCNYLPVMRMTECYYIAAECLKESNPTRAIEILNYVRSGRGLSNNLIDGTGMSATDVQNEVFKEYRKEFMGEGQLFFYYKRINAANIIGSSKPANKGIYVMPIPSNDKEFGGYSN